jgi:hypothetical protein
MPVGKNKIRPDWPIDIETEELFREFVVKKHGTYARGLLGLEANKAYLSYMRLFLKSKGITASKAGKITAHAHTKFDDKTSQQQAVNLRDMIVRFLIDRLRYEEQPKIRVGFATLKAAICGVTGIKDHRAIKSRLTLLESCGLISQCDFEFKIFEIISGPDSSLDGHMAKPPRGVVG